MENSELELAKTQVNESYEELSAVVDEIVSKITYELDTQVDKLSAGIDTYSNNDLRDIMTRISVETYFIGITKEQSSLKESCAIALYKESSAKAYAKAVGPNEAKKNQAVIDTVSQQAVSMLYSAVTGILKTKCDEGHRIVSVLNGVLISRAADAKQQTNPRTELDTMNTLDDIGE